MKPPLRSRVYQIRIGKSGSRNRENDSPVRFTTSACPFKRTLAPHPLLSLVSLRRSLRVAPTRYYTSRTVGLLCRNPVTDTPGCAVRYTGSIESSKVTRQEGNYNNPTASLVSSMMLILQWVFRRRFFVRSPAIRLPRPSLSFRTSVGRNQVIGQMTLKLVAISYAFHAPDNQLLTQDVIHLSETRRRRKGVPRSRN